MAESIGKAYKPWLILSLGMLLGGLLLLVVAGTVAFLDSNGSVTPLWVIVVGVVGVLGLGLGFAGFFLIMMTAGWLSFREQRRVQVIPPDRSKG